MESEPADVVEAEVVTYTREPWKDILLEAMASGTSLREACRSVEGLPSHMTVYREAAKDPQFATELTEARKALAEAQQDDLDELTAEARKARPEQVPGLRLAADNVKFKLVKVLPKLYGDQPSSVVNVDNRQQIVVLDDKRRSELQDRLKQWQLGESNESNKRVNDNGGS